LRAASPTNTESWNGILTDIDLLINDPKFEELKNSFAGYLGAIQAQKYNINKFLERIEEAQDLISNIKSMGLSLPTKKSFSGYLGQIATKEEAAGKLRCFAIVDSLTQSTLNPLHNALFDLLSKIPNDGTFDQDASVRRCQEKALKAGCAWSFDLSAATDRLPADLSARILDKIFGEAVGEFAVALLTQRDFHISESIRKTYGNESTLETVRYKVGQPMGAKSSWAMLAITHHWILQYVSPTPKGI